MNHGQQELPINDVYVYFPVQALPSLTSGNATTMVTLTASKMHDPTSQVAGTEAATRTGRQ